MTKIKYLAFTCEFPELEALLNHHGAQGWRCMTCEPVATVGPQGTGVLNAFVIMDIMYDDGEDDPDEPASEGLAMKG